MKTYERTFKFFFDMLESTHDACVNLQHVRQRANVIETCVSSQISLLYHLATMPLLLLNHFSMYPIAYTVTILKTLATMPFYFGRNWWHSNKIRL